MAQHMGTMFSYTNRKGVTYHLHGHADRAGKTRYTLKRDAEGALAELPSGYEVVESVNARASVRRIRPRKITAEEEGMARSSLARHGPDAYRIEVKDEHITVFQPDRDPEEIAEVYDPLDVPAGIRDVFENALRQKLGDQVVDEYVQRRKREFRDRVAQTVGYSPVMRFSLVDKRRREFTAARMTYSGYGGWRKLRTMGLPEALERYIPHLGKESFYELV